MAEGARSVVVTGTAKGIGRAIAQRLTDEGWIVVGLERTDGSDSVLSGACAQVVIGDASSRHAHEQAAATANGLAPLSAWVNNAGITKRTKLHELEQSDVEQIVGTNGFGYIWGCSVAVGSFVEHGVAGAVVNIGSIHGRSSFTDHAVYEFTKGGIDALSRSIAVTYGPYGIRANTVAPGGVMTPHLEQQIASAVDPAAEHRALSEGPPMGRIALASEVAAVVSFLVSDESPYLTGQSIAVDGGWTSSFGKIVPNDDLRARFSQA